MFVKKMFGSIHSEAESGRYLKILLTLGAVVSILWSVYFALVTISIPYQIELREGAAQVMTGFLLNRNNPFVFENQPLSMNNYGLGYYAVVAPFAAFFGNTLLVHRSVTFVFVLLASFTVFFVVHKLQGDAAPALACAAFIMIGLMSQGGIGAVPSAMGTFLFILSVSIPSLKSFSLTSLVLSVLFSIAAFYTKAYFVLGVGIVASYLFLFVSKKRGLSYSVLFLILFAISFSVLRLAFPLYFINTVIGNISNTERSSTHLFAQLAQLLIYFFPVLLSTLLFMPFEKNTFKQAASQKFNLRGWKQPLVGALPDYFLYSFVCTLLAFILILGSHIGSYLSYAYQLIVPVFFCWYFLKFDRKKSSFLTVIAVLFNLFYWQVNVLSPHMLEQKNSTEWASLYSHVRSASNILNSPVITSAVIDFALHPLDSGQTAYFYSVQPYPNSAIFGPLYETFHTDGFRYIKFIDKSIEEQEFDLIFTTVEKSAFYHVKLVEEFYAPVDEITVDMPQTGQQWTVVIWRPIAR